MGTLNLTTYGIHLSPYVPLFLLLYVQHLPMNPHLLLCHFAIPLQRDILIPTPSIWTGPHKLLCLQNESEVQICYFGVWISRGLCISICLLKLPFLFPREEYGKPPGPRIRVTGKWDSLVFRAKLPRGLSAIQASSVESSQSADR